MKVCFLPTFAAGAALALIGITMVRAAPDDWAEGTIGQNDGANRSYYNAGGQLPWRNAQGDWRDANDTPQGNIPIAVAVIARGNKGSIVEWDITELARRWAAGKARHKGLLLRNTDTSGNFSFHSRAAVDVGQRPQLLLIVNGTPRSLDAIADTFLVSSTYRSQGNSELLKIAGAFPALVRFDLSGLKPNDKIDRAALRLVTATEHGAGSIGIFACDQGEKVKDSEPTFGLAANYARDRGISKDTDVLFATGFEADNWQKEWTNVGGEVETVAQDPKNKFESLDGKACRAFLAKGALTAMNQTYQFRKQGHIEPQEVYFRYYLRFGDNWQPTLDGGKMPGISGTYGRAGWGGRKVNGSNGWSARGSFRVMLPKGNPLAGTHPLGFYYYHADMPGTYGDIWVWNKSYRGFLENNRWYCIEQHVKLNTLGKDGEKGVNNGVLRAWVDGRLAFERADLRFRDVDSLKIEQIWMNVYHGGTKPSPQDQHLYVDNVVVARRYIGPMK